MAVYLLRRLLVMIPTLFGITLVSFIIINLAPGSPVEQRIQQMRMGGGASGGEGRSQTGVSQEVIDALKRQYGFDKPVHVRYVIWLKNISRMDFGNSFTYEEPVIDVIKSKMPVSLTFGIVSLILTYIVCIPLGVLKAVKDGTLFDAFSSVLLFVMLSIPPVMLAVLLVVFFAGGSYLDWFPIGGMTSDNYSEMTSIQQHLDRIHHMILPLICYMIGSFTFLTFLMKNSMLDVVKLDYIRTAQAKGLSQKVVYMKHALRNALIPIVTGLSGILSVFFAGSIIIERVFQLDGMGQLGLTSINARDYNVIMGLIFIQSLLFLIGRLIADLLYVVVDPRIDFS
jgi:microcin C transport system permease protein